MRFSNIRYIVYTHLKRKSCSYRWILKCNGNDDNIIILKGDGQITVLFTTKWKNNASPYYIFLQVIIVYQFDTIATEAVNKAV